MGSMKERDEKGRFLPGNQAARGNKGGRPRLGRPIDLADRPRAKELLDIFSSEASDEDWRQIIRRAIIAARNNDSRARQWLSDYCIGSPAQIIELRQQERGIERLMEELLAEDGGAGEGE